MRRNGRVYYNSMPQSNWVSRTSLLLAKNLSSNESCSSSFHPYRTAHAWTRSSWWNRSSDNSFLRHQGDLCAISLVRHFIFTADKYRWFIVYRVYRLVLLVTTIWLCLSPSRHMNHRWKTLKQYLCICSMQRDFIIMFRKNHWWSTAK